VRRIIFAVLLLLGIVFFFAQIEEIQAIVQTTQKGDWRFLLLALGVQVIWFINVAASYRVIFLATGIKENIERLLLLASASNFANVVAPTAGVSGMALLIHDARQRGHSTGRVTAAGVIYLLTDYAGFLCILSLGIVVLLRRHNLNTAEIIASAILVLVAMAIAALMYLGMRSAQTLGNVLAWVARHVNSLLWNFFHRPYLSEARAHLFAREIEEGLRELRDNPEKLFPALALALTNKTLLISILLLVFLSFKAPISIGTLVAGFSVAYLFLIVSPTPSGIGVVEGVMTLVLRSMYIPLGTAVLISLTYRGITFWLPLLFGLIAFRRLARTSDLKTAI
jgi:uncharacterized protein (TIRG00374 family)